MQTIPTVNTGHESEKPAADADGGLPALSDHEASLQAFRQRAERKRAEEAERDARILAVLKRRTGDSARSGA